MRSQLNRRAASVLVAIVVAVLIMMMSAVSVRADEPVTSVTPPATTAPGTTVPPLTTPAPTTTLAPTVSTPGTTSPPHGSTSTTTTLDSNAPTTTILPPDENQGGFSNTPAPEVPAASTDPLFHAARTVDEDIRLLDKAHVKADALVVIEREAAQEEAKERVVLDQSKTVDAAAQHRMVGAEHDLRTAAMHAYTGYGAQTSAESRPGIDDQTLVLPYKTYVAVTIKEATSRVRVYRSAAGATHADLTAATDAYNVVAARASRTKQDADAARAATVAAFVKLGADQKALQDLVGTLADLAPGTLQKLPEPTDVKPGSQLVRSPAGTIVVPPGADRRTALVLQFIIGQLGKPYVWGAVGPSTYDCSGLMLRAFQALGVTSIPRVSQAQQMWATPVAAADAQPGDLVFFGRPAYHVGIYIGGGLMLNAPYSGTVVRIDKVWSSVTGYGRPVWPADN